MDYDIRWLLRILLALATVGVVTLCCVLPLLGLQVLR